MTKAEYCSSSENMSITRLFAILIARSSALSCHSSFWLASRSLLRLFTRAMMLCSILLLGACATPGPGPETESTVDAVPVTPTSPTGLTSVTDRTVAGDMVKVATQIFPPVNTTLQINTSGNDPLMRYFAAAFANAGYGIQRVSADQGSNFFSYDRSEEATDSGETLVRFNTSIGAVDIGRDYTIPGVNVISPASPFRLSGTRIPVTVADEPSGRMRIQNPEYSQASYVASLNLDGQAPPVISLITSDLVDRVASDSSAQSGLQAINTNQVEVNNLFYADQSNFTSILDDYEQVESQVVVFGDDSLVLGNTNKLLIAQMVEDRLEPGDIVSLVGCSNGPTALEIGNEGLALGRAERVTQALTSQGVPRDRILDEGCWAPVSAGDKFPSRGVVMELWRPAS